MTMLSTESPVYTPRAAEATGVDSHIGSRGPFLSATHLDQSLMAQIQERDVEAFALLYDRHAARLYTLALHCTGNSSSAEKIVIDVFQTIWSSTDTFVGRTDVACWLIDMVRQHAIWMLKGSAGQQKNIQARFEQSSTSEQLKQLGHHEAVKIRIALQSLPVAQRMSIELAYYDGLSQAEIAARLAHPLGMVQRNLRQGLLSLRDRLFGK